MMKLKKIFMATILLGLLLCCGISVHAADVVASGSCGTNITYTLDNNGLLTINGEGEMTSSPWYTNYRKLVKKAVIENGVTTIVDHAFEDCTELESIIIPNGVTSIGKSAFYDCAKLEIITISSDIANIGTSAFTGCTGLNGVYITDLNSWYNIDFGNQTSNPLIYAHNMYLNNKLITELTIPSDITSIKDFAFRGWNGLKSITISENVTSIGEQAFYGCAGLTSITIPSKVTNVGNYAFFDCKGLTKVYWNTNAITYFSRGNYIFTNAGIESAGLDVVFGDNVIKIPDNLFYECIYLKSITIPSGLTRIGTYAFYGCSGLTNIYWNAISVSDFSTENYVFGNAGSGGTGINIVFGDSVERIPAYAFCPYRSGNTSSYNPKIANITIGENVTDIGERAFFHCETLNGVYITDLSSWCRINFGDYYSNPLNYAHSLYLNNELITELVIPNDITIIKNYSFSGSSNLKSITIGENVTSIGEGAFRDCLGLIKINWHAKIVSNFTSSNYIFYNAGANETGVEIIFGDKVEMIPEYAFRSYTTSYTPKITSITIGKNISNIGKYAFYGCTELTHIYWNAKSVSDFSDENYIFYKAGQNGVGIDLVIGDNVEKIPAYAFCPYARYNEYSAKIASVTIGKALANVGKYAFMGCSPANEIYIPDLSLWCKINFANSSSNPSANVPNIYINNELITELTIPSDITSIGNSKFMRWIGLKSITIGENVTSIGEQAFYGCVGLTNITIPVEVTSVGDYAFYDCANLENVYYSGGKEDWESVSIGFNNKPLLNALILFNGNTITIYDEKISGNSNTYTYSFSMRSKENILGTFIIALYSDNRLVGCVTETLSTPSTKYISTDKPISVDSVPTLYKIFFWNSFEKLAPLCDNVEGSIIE